MKYLTPRQSADLYDQGILTKEEALWVYDKDGRPTANRAALFDEDGNPKF